MDFTTIVNKVLFPITLFVVIFASFYVEPYLVKSQNKTNVNKLDDYYNYFELEQFFEFVSKDINLMTQLEKALKEENFIEHIVKLGNSLNYTFTASELRQSIAEHTANPYGNYICLPIGCYQIGSA